ncbi:MAG: PDZ domain-containing protein [Saprospiraceae bacterium]
MLRLSIKQWALLPAILLACSAFLPAQEYITKTTTHKFSQHNPCKPFIGVGTSTVSEGLIVDYTVENTPATKYGIQAGDVILTLDGVPVRSQSELLRERDKHQQGEAFSLTILREGAQKTINARFKACNAEEMELAQQKIERIMEAKEIRMVELDQLMQDKFKGLEMGERTILGVYEDNGVNEPGLVISSVVPGKGAEAAGLQGGDMVVKVDGKTVTGSTTLGNALTSHKPGDKVKVIYIRDGETHQTEVVLSADRHSFSFQTEKRDPCKVFIGVYTSENALEGRGARVDGVIGDTPAKAAGVQPGDIILALNGQTVNNHQEILVERNKNKPGDAFTLTVLRNDVTMTIKARFKSCDTPGDVQVNEDVLEENTAIEQREAPQTVENTLNLEVFEAYPSPTLGLINIKFEAEAVPTVVRILDVSGREVYRNELPKFGGSFNEQVNISNNKAGNYVLSIQQGDKVQSKQIVLLSRA